MDKLGSGVDVERALGRVQPVLVVDDEYAARHGVVGAQLRPSGQVSFEVRDEALRGWAAGGLPASARVGNWPVCDRMTGLASRSGAAVSVLPGPDSCWILRAGGRVKERVATAERRRRRP